MTQEQKQYSNVTVTPLENSEVLIEGEIVAEHLEECRKKILKGLTDRAEIPGFRKGATPEHIVVSHFGESYILEQAAQEALDREYWSIVTDYSVRAIGNPEITITKLAKGNPLGFKIKTAVLPEVKLPDYKALAKKENAAPEESTEVEQKEVDDVIEQLRKSKALETTGKTETLPEVDDAFAQSVGTFKTVAELTEKIRENLVAEKKLRAKEKRRLAILESVLSKTDVSVPKILIENELQKMIAQFKDDIARAGLTYDGYLKHIKKTEADIKMEWTDNAVKRAKTQLILGKISREEKIAPEEELINKEVEHVLSHHKDADRFRVRMFVENMLTNEKVLEFLESQK